MKYLKKLPEISEKFDSLKSDFPYLQWYSVVLDIVNSKLFKKPSTRSKKSPPNEIWKVQFVNKDIEAISLSNVLNSTIIECSF